ncbi:BamA/TamA family outer membrane protein [bacterium]|nr:BamA/TamA family outer membrane protein [bacterium]
MPRSILITLTVVLFALTGIPHGVAGAADDEGAFISINTAELVGWEDGKGFRPTADIYYNRVDGLLFYAGVEYERYESMHPRLEARRGWASARADNYYFILVEQPLFSADSFSLGVSLYNRSAWSREDEEMITDIENNLLALFFRQEFRNYFRREGLTIFAEHEFTTGASIRVEYASDELSSLDTRQHVWSAFRTKSDWEENPPLERGILDGAEEYEGVLKNLTCTFAFDNHDPVESTGWDVTLRTEYAGSATGGDYDYRRTLLKTRRYFRLSPTQTLNVRVSWGVANGTDFPSHKLFHLGGMGNLRGYDYNEFEGKHLFFASVEYGVHVIEDLELIYFADAGRAWFGTAPTTYDSDEMNYNIGIGLRLGAPGVGDVRVDVARPATTEDADIRVILRLETAF